MHIYIHPLKRKYDKKLVQFSCLPLALYALTTKLYNLEGTHSDTLTLLESLLLKCKEGS
jgi:hypothetical protein